MPCKIALFVAEVSALTKIPHMVWVGDTFTILIVFVQRWALDPEEFRLGVQKCRKTIEDCIGSDDTFNVRGVQAIFNIIRRKVDMNSGETKGKPI